LIFMHNWTDTDDNGTGRICMKTHPISSYQCEIKC
jgi:hypothetical protein